DAKAKRDKSGKGDKGQGRLTDDDGGHLIGAQFKGPKDIDNLVPQNSQINRSGENGMRWSLSGRRLLMKSRLKKLLLKLNQSIQVAP
ncbi:DNA/RNA non-specific endonuclease, partial [Paenibacillus silvae]|uniref:DNA/RNA non-specific endonuclease n=1 Tax=Paenibacillus silvae TaxID=1325358 RepID=UPI003B8A8587